MTQLKNNRLLKAIWHEPLDATPVWLMRQAGRYLPEYRSTRSKAGTFMNLCKTPDLACEVTLQPLKRFDLDAAIIFSDILTIPDAMGLELHFIEGEGPYFTQPLISAYHIAQLGEPDLSHLHYVYEALKLTHHELAGSVPLIGFCGSPWTLAVYMIEGKSTTQFPVAMNLRAENPQLLHVLLDKLAKWVMAHLNAQINAGADVVMLFDTWGGLLSTHDYPIFSANYIQQIIQGLIKNKNGNKIPVILFTRGGSKWLTLMSQLGCDVIGLDWEISLAKARQEVQAKVALQGNMNPATLLTTKDAIRLEVMQILQSYGKGSGHIFNLGHGVTPDVPPEHVQFLVETVHDLSKTYHDKTEVA